MNIKNIKLALPMLALGIGSGFSFNVSAVDFTLFGSAGYSSNSAEGNNNEFALGGLDFYATTQIDDETRGFVEYVFENGSDGLVTDLERIWVARDITDSFTLGIGRFHTPLGHWNRTFHHGAFMQDTISRPFFLDFEDGAAGVLPVHVVGLMGWGTIPLSWGSMSYETFIANGPSIDSDGGLNVSPSNKPEIGIGASGDLNEDKAFGGRLMVEPDSIAVKASFFFFTSAIAEAGTGYNFDNINIGDTIIDQTISGIDLNYEVDKFGFALEYYSFNNDSLIGAAESHTGTAYYVEAKWNLTETTKIIIRQEDLAFDNNDNYFQLLGAGQGSHTLFAIRHDLSETNSLKFEVNQSSPKVGDSDTTVGVEWAFLMF